MLLGCGARRIDLGVARVMGVLNITPDSFSDGGRLFRAGAPDIGRAVHMAERMHGQGALLVDVGGESTRPGATPVGAAEELDRVVPVVEAIRARVDIAISVDTSTPEVMREAVQHGASMINDVRALGRPGAIAAVAATDAAVCLMHMRGEPGTMQLGPVYDDVVTEVVSFLRARAAACLDAGIAQERLVLDPGFGFGKTFAHNLTLFRGLDRLIATGFPVLIGVSRKSMIGQALGRPAGRRLAGGLALATLAAAAGARLVRTHDVAATCDALAMTAVVREAGSRT